MTGKIKLQPNETPRVFHTEEFDDYSAVINGYSTLMRLTIFYFNIKHGRHFIVYQEDKSGRRCLKKLQKSIGDYRYGLIE